MRRLQHAKVSGLFGYMNHAISFRVNEPTILTAPNGAGKTHVLMLIRAALKLDAKTLMTLPFSNLSLTSDDGLTLKIDRLVQSGDKRQLKFRIQKNRRTVGQGAVLNEADIEEDKSGLPSFMREMPDGRWYDGRNERFVSPAHVEKRFNVNLSQNGVHRFKDNPEIVDFVVGLNPILIDTKRLDVYHSQLTAYGLNSAEPLDRRYPRTSTADLSPTGSPIRQYIDQIRIQVNDAQRASVRATQLADVSFATRALKAAKATVNKADLRARYNGVIDKYEDLASNGLAIGEDLIEFPSETTPTVRRILSVFLDDWEDRLDPLVPLNKKLRTLREILDTKLKKSGKKTVMGPGGRLGFQTVTGERRVLVANLSSGEQHLVALFTMLLFVATEGSVVLIDEPEISMHAAWKHAFLEDISNVARLANLQVVISTHSTSIINGRWGLTEELGFTPIPEPASGENDDPSNEADDLLD